MLTELPSEPEKPEKTEEPPSPITPVTTTTTAAGDQPTSNKKSQNTSMFLKLIVPSTDSAASSLLVFISVAQDGQVEALAMK